jgi:hypothetical protein
VAGTSETITLGGLFLPTILTERSTMWKPTDTISPVSKENEEEVVLYLLAKSYIYYSKAEKIYRTLRLRGLLSVALLTTSLLCVGTETTNTFSGLVVATLFVGTIYTNYTSLNKKENKCS